MKTEEFTIMNDNDEIKGQPLKLLQITSSATTQDVQTRLNLNSINLQELHSAQDKIIQEGTLQLDKPQLDTLYHTTIPLYIFMSNSQNIMNIICAYAPQSGYREQEKDEFWEDMDEVMVNIPSGETKFVMGDLTFRIRDVDILRALTGEDDDDIESEQESDGDADHISAQSNTDSEVDADIPSSDSDSDNLPLSRLQQASHTEYYKGKDGDMKNTYDNPETMWSNFEDKCKGSASNILGISKGGLRNGKDPSWWDDEVKSKILNKKILFKNWQSSSFKEDQDKYKEAKSIAKKCVAQTRAKAREEFYNRINKFFKIENANSESESEVAKSNKSTEDIKASKYIEDKDKKLLTNNKDINKRWYEYYKDLMNKEFPSQVLEPLAPVEGPIQAISRDEIKNAVKKMKNGKVVGPDEIPAEVWKLLQQVGLEWLTRLFNLILDNAIQAVRIVIEKYRVNKEDLHLIFIDLEKAFDRRFAARTVKELSRNFVLPLGTTNSEVIQERLERVGGGRRLKRERRKKLVQDIYTNARTRVRSPAGLTEEFEVGVGVHQGSALSPLLFNLVMDFITKPIQSPLPWNLLYADDIVLIDRSTAELQTTLTAWATAHETAGLKVGRAKTEHLQCRFSENSNIMEAAPEMMSYVLDSPPSVQSSDVGFSHPRAWY
ncbi:uncharacterized protein LOC125075627 [Vanessa atalanta]|uniref:uncharacterized protein LOC125075627 n=1 Tax=Vanessa atalanta TaxID=42275 RepID=UPI001FCCD8C8|nr:uncharacterized protein LOC125075627 [Vanessa atalanta]